jgi:hypothetical protein
LVALAEKRERRFTPMTATRMDADGRLKEECEKVLDVWFEGVKVGHYRLNYLRASNIEIGLLLNFGPKAQFERLVYSNSNKPMLAAE